MEQTILHIQKNIRRFSHVLAAGAAFLITQALLFLILFFTFSRITYDSLSDNNRDFAMQIDTLTDTINSSIINYGMQIFYSDPARILMGSSAFSHTERVYHLRTLNTSLSSTDYVDQILVYNGYTDHIYSTDSAYPDQTTDQFSHVPLRTLLTERDSAFRFKPIHCIEKGNNPDEYYAFMFYELNSDNTPKPSALIISVNSDWYKRALLAANPDSNLIVIDEAGSILVSANEFLENEYLQYYPQISGANSSGYFLNKRNQELCMYYQSPITKQTYMRISSLSTILPRFVYLRRIVLGIFIGMVLAFVLILIGLLAYTFFPMLHMETALNQINTLQTGNDPDQPDLSIRSRERIEAVVLRSERASLEQIFYDMLISKAELSEDRLFKTREGSFGLLLVHAPHRKDVYTLLDTHDFQMIVTKFSHMYACISRFSTTDEYQSCQNLLAQTLDGPCFAANLFEDFSSLRDHIANLDELYKLSLLIAPDTKIVPENILNKKVSVNTITNRDFTELTVRMKSANLEACRTKWTDIRSVLLNLRYDELTYTLSRTEKTICNVLAEFSSNLPDENGKLLPDSSEPTLNLIEIDEVFDRAFIAACENYKEKKAEKYSGLAARIQALVQENYHDTTLNSQSIADQIQMNNAYLGRLFKNSYGRSINDYINTCRIEESMRLLRTSDTSIDEIAQSVGFANVKYFYVLFKKHTGITPTKYRKQPQTVEDKM